jgi:purine-binding chemotaxis protein CheW
MNTELTIEPSEIAGKYLTFNLMEEHYGVSVEWILQIIAIPEITKIPKTPYFVKGVINLRGKIIPVLDLRLKFNLPEQVYDDRTSIIVIQIKTSNDDVFIGIIVDKVLEVIDINKDEIEKTPTFGVDFDSGFILGMAKVKNKVISLLNVEKILTNSELNQIAGVSNE